MKKNKFLLMTISLLIFVIFLTSCSVFVSGSTDYVSVVNDITVYKMSANVKIENKRTGYFAGGTKTDEIIGSGVIVGKDIYDYYYVITNYHVMDLEEYSRQTLKTVDYLGNSHSFDSSCILALDKDRDLALVKFYSSYDYDYVAISSTYALNGEAVFAVGYPSGQANAITIGSLTGKINAPMLDDESQLKDFNGEVLKVYRHSALIFGGSSGGMLLDETLCLVGINYAGNALQDGTFICGYAIPSPTVIEFISKTPAKNLVSIY